MCYQSDADYDLGCSPKLNIGKILDDFKFSFIIFVVTVNVSFFEFFGIQNPISKRSPLFVIPLDEKTSWLSSLTIEISMLVFFTYL